jgi:S-DNA-T family DNA segregation ATPase FtsK/SpoIIIE
MPTPPTFQRPPRHPLELPKGEVEIPALPPAPTKPSVSLLPVLLPGIFAVAALAVTLVTTATGGSFLASALSFGFMGISSLTAFLNYNSQKKTYQQAMDKRETGYRAALDSRRQELARLRAQQQQLLCANDPDLRECLARVERRPEPDRRLWERSPKDADFLALRLGVGARPSSIAIKIPQPADMIDIDPLLTEAQTLAQQFASVPDAPICLPLLQAGVAGVAGPRGEALSAARGLLMQLATHHSPDEVKIVALFPADEAARWDWLRWLPHVWTDDRNHRLLACDKDAAHRLLSSLLDLLNRRRVQRDAAKDTAAAVPLPCFVFLFADPRLIENEPIVPLLLGYNGALGVYPLFIADRVETLPKGCQAVVEVGGNQGRLIQTAPTTVQTTFTSDAAPLELADRQARAMAPIHLQQLSAVTEIPKLVPLLDLLGAKAVEDLDVIARWQKSEPYRSLAVPIGKRVAGEPFTLDIHGGGQGPHGLVAGTTGSGKSELLQSLIASLAVDFHPHQVVFVLIDYKGGGMANAFRELPHLVGTITNLQGNLAMRALTALKSELHRRETLLAQAGTTSINDYQRRHRNGQVKEPLPHLVIIADEFAELKTELPDFMVELVRAARLGRSLGVHLILATQKPAGVVSEEIWANSSFRICLRVERPEDSQEVLRSARTRWSNSRPPGAARATPPAERPRAIPTKSSR